MAYSLIEHRHRFAAWAAGRAAGTKGCRFAVEEGRGLIEGTDIPLYAADRQGAPETPEDFDGRHRLWREQMVAQAQAKRIGGANGCFTHGVAAKLINIYLKLTVICSLSPLAQEEPSRADIIHPPIDRLLLLALAQHAKVAEPFKRTSDCHWRKYAALGWSNFNSEDYENVIGEVRRFSNGKPLWTIEEYWIGHQSGDKGVIINHDDF
ncbi:hypothetical protein MKK63_11755 [Methylobacterium sp. J-088]|uniref:hypothetical protein n=1 Tax=Methylobacterium sp. J-088 TaxID=2836664 RepID=UPI001FBACEDE|nr:hypothetical protein [Methylobacterium sp. J-088]MCJ2063384.1 hypothetical protein [Methylobacterium sp. J-088]